MLQGGPHSTATLDSLCSVMAAELQELTIWVRDVMDQVASLPKNDALLRDETNRARKRVSEVTKVLNGIDFTNVSPESRAAILSGLRALQSEIHESGKAKWIARLVDEIAVCGEEDPINVELAALRSASSLEEVYALVEASQTLGKATMLPHVCKNVLCNENLTVAEFDEFIAKQVKDRMFSHFSDQVCETVSELSTNGATAFIAQYRWANRSLIEQSGREREILDLLLERAKRTQDWVGAVIGIVESPYATKELISQLPCDQLVRYNSTFSDAASQAFSSLLCAAVDGLDVSGLEQFDRLLSEFTGTISELGTMCAVAVNV